MTKHLTRFLLFLSFVYSFHPLSLCDRIVELHGGYFSDTFRDEPLFIANESRVSSLIHEQRGPRLRLSQRHLYCCSALNAGHPVAGFKSRERDGRF